MNFQLQEVLQQMGLSEGYHIPIANAENVKLEADLRSLILAKAKAASTLDSLNAKHSGLETHMKYVRAEQLENQNILFARNTQLKNEKHMYTLLKMERERELQETRKMINEEIKVEESKQNKFTSLKVLMSKMEKLKLSVKWDEQTIESLEEIVLKKDDDNEVIKKFSKEDRRKADDLEVKRKRLREEELARGQLVIRLANEIENMQMAIGRNVQMYKQMCEERNLMVRQWQDSVKQLQQRNKDTIMLVNEIVSVKDLIASNTTILEEQRQFAENERANNYEMEMTINIGNTNVARTRNMLSSCIQQVQDQNVELSAVLRDLRATATTLEEERANKRRVEFTLKAQMKTLELTRSTVDRLHKQLKSVQDSNLSAEERLRQLEEMVQCEEKTGDLLINDIERIQGVIFRSQSALANLIEAFKLKQLKQKVDENALVTLQRQKAQAELDARLSAETLYKLNFRINMLENRLARATGERQDDFSEMYQIRLRELKATLTSVNETSNLLQMQITKLEDDMRRMSIATTTNAELLDTLRARLNDRMLMVEGAVKLVKQQRSNNNNKKVEQNVLAVRLKGAEKSVQKEGGIIYDLQRQKMELDAAVRERQTEVIVEKELLYCKRRALQDDTGRMRGDIQLRKIKIEQLKKRLECILESLGRSEDGEALTITYFRVKNAQEKFSLQQEGDRLDGLIKKSEREIIALENTLRVVNSTNKAYKKSLDLLDDNGEELAELQRREDRYKEVGIALRNRTKVLTDRSRIVRSMRACVDDIREKYYEITQEVQQQQCKLNEICDEENIRKTKLNRAIVAATTKSTLCACGDSFIDVATRQYKDVNNSTLQQLLEISVRFLETEPIINKYLTENALPLLSSFKTLSQTSLRRSSNSSIKSSSTAKSEESTSSVLPSVLYTLNMP